MSKICHPPLSRQRKSGGYVALLAVLVVGAASVAAVLALLTMGTDSQRSVMTAEYSAKARGLASACAEEALQIMHDTPTFAGTANLSLGQGTCSYTVTNTGGNARTIQTTGVVKNVVIKVRLYATIEPSSISIISWKQEG